MTNTLYFALAGSELTLWWEKIPSFTGEYTVETDGKLAGKTTKTHFSVPSAEKDMHICVKAEKECVGEIDFHHKIPGRRVSALEFGAKGDGISMNTDALQKAIDSLAYG